MKKFYNITDEEKVREDAKMLEVLELLRKHKQILELAAEGLTIGEIGKRMFRSGRTIETPLYRMMRVTESKNTTALVVTALKLGIIK